jgi:large repetitive protein
MKFVNQLRANVIRSTLLLVAGFLLVAPVFAGETLTYSYDARGRLVQVVHSGAVNNGTTANYTYDKADNRSNVTVSTGGTTTITLSPATLPNGTVGTGYSQTISANGGTSPYTYSKTAGTLPTSLTLNSSTGLLSGTPTTAATYNFTITATDSASNTGSRAYSVTVSGGSTTLTLSPATLPSGTVGTAYSQTISASGGTSPYTFVRSAGTLPVGLALSSAGVLSGTPTTAATYNFTITASDGAGDSGSQSYSVTVSPANNLTLSPTTLANGTVSTAYSQTITASGGTGPNTFTKSTGTLPTGLTLSSGGVLSGTPTTAATYSFTVKAADSTGNHIGTKAYSVTIGSSASTCSGVSFSVNDVSVTEGSPLVFTVTKAGSAATTCSVNYATADGTATASFNYIAASGTFSFSSSQTSQTVNVSTIDNGGSTGTSVTMFLNLSSPTSGGTISDSQGVGSIFGSGTGSCGGNVCGLNATPETPPPAPADSGTTTSDPTPPSSDTTNTPQPPQGGE